MQVHKIKGSALEVHKYSVTAQIRALALGTPGRSVKLLHDPTGPVGGRTKPVEASHGL
jgi:hypothetical protein